MKRYFFIVLGLCFLGLELHAQTFEKEQSSYENSADRLLSTDGRLTIGGYGEVHFNQALNSDVRSNGKLDVHRMVMLLGYNFSERTQFITEIEFEHVKEVYIEQAFLQHKLNNYINLKGGLLLIPMGIINEYHEPTTFNGVERPLVDNVIAPTTWREVGFGVSGNIFPVTLRYQLYLVNGFNGYNGAGVLNGQNGFRKGRQKGAESYISSPNFTGKVEYYGVRGLNIGLSGYFGNTQSTLYDGIDKNDSNEMAVADSSVVGISMMGLDARFVKGGLQLKGQLYLTGVSNTEQYNKFISTDLGSSIVGYYMEAGYNVLRMSKTEMELIPFIRTEKYNTHHKVAGDLIKNTSYNQSVVTTGLTLKLAQGAVVKTDIQFRKSEADDNWSKVFSAGFGVMF
ncbi:hypothetical protein [Maribellus maritimus]|uniref:hypothetical protein n=1 Tax=Maribellus maritimus TaxID=2870838 RepID=UPI001EEB5FDE|nr:hypothetical protein [Maribellus maritimus]MCG6189246.1 hypothetical protein [Maribellus maritimus]